MAATPEQESRLGSGRPARVGTQQGKKGSLRNLHDWLRARNQIVADDSHWKRCGSCGERIPSFTTVCGRCRSYQGRLWWGRLFAVSLPWISAITAAGFYIYGQWYGLAKTLRSEVVLFSTVKKDELRIEIANEGDNTVFVSGSFFVCNTRRNPNSANYKSEDLTELFDTKNSLLSHSSYAYHKKISKELTDALGDPAKFCRVSLLLNDYRGKSDVIYAPPVYLDKIKIEGRPTSPDEQ